MGLVGWVATHTGLPSFYATGTGPLTAVTRVGERLIADVEGDVLVSDPGADPGVDTTYRFGSESVVLRRRGQAPVSSGQRLDAVTTADGVTVADVGIVWGDPREHDTGASVFTSALGRQIPRYRLGVPPETGTLEAVTFGEASVVLRGLVQERQPLWVLHDVEACSRADCDVEGARLIVPHRLVERMSERRTRAQRNWEVSYSRVPDALGVSGVGRAVGCPVVSWGQWEAWGRKSTPSGWQDWSAVEVCRRVAGMPQV